MSKKIIGICMLSVFFIALIVYCVYMADNFWRGVGVFALSILMTAFVVAAVFFTFKEDEE